MPYSLVTAPATEPVTLLEAKAQCRVDGSDDDTLLSSLITVVRQKMEEQFDICLIAQTWDLYLDAFPASTLKFSKFPLSSVTSIKYYDPDDTEATVSSSSYVVDIYSRCGRVVLKTGYAWPSTSLRVANGVVIRFVAGYANAAAVPSPIKQAILMMIGDLYENRENLLISSYSRVSAQNLDISKLLTMNHRSFHF